MLLWIILIPLIVFVAFLVWAIGAFLTAKWLFSSDKAKRCKQDERREEQLREALLSTKSLSLGEAALLDDLHTSSHKDDIMFAVLIWPIWIPFALVIAAFLWALVLLSLPIVAVTKHIEEHCLKRR